MTVARHIGIDATAWLADSLGDNGVPRDQVLALAPRLEGLRRRLQAWRAGDEPSFYALPFAAHTDRLGTRAAAIARQYARTIVFGIGGASLGGEMLCQVLGQASRPVRFYDNVDPTTLATIGDTDWTDTLLLVISKSGDTAETLTQFLTALPELERQLGPTGARGHVLVITENTSGALYRLAGEIGLEVLPHPPVGGRYSVLSIVGLLPAAIAGVDVEAVLAGARSMAERCAQPGLEENPAFWNGALQFLHAERGRTLSVQMVYADRLRPVTRWFRQLCGESLGKRDAMGKARGLAPIDSYGTTDQHSQLQLYLDGPDDKQFTLIVDPALRTQGRRVPERFTGIPAVEPLANHTTGELFIAEFNATRESLTRHGRPNRTFSLASNDARAIGELIMLLETETVVLAELMGVNPFDQPAVEESKMLARQYLKEFGV